MKSHFLNEKYQVLLETMNLAPESEYSKIYFRIKELLNDFIDGHKRVALYCYGVHTQMLMADFVAELRDIVCIIDNGIVCENSDFKIIKDVDIENYDIDGVVISSFKYRKEIKEGLKQNHKSVDVLELYEGLEKYDIFLDKEFYNAGAYQIYSRINMLLRQSEDEKYVDTCRELLDEYVYIKEFRLAENLAKKIHAITKEKKDKNIWRMISDLYKDEIRTLSQVSRGNTLLLCLDGMRREDMYSDKMKKTYSILKESSHIYENAYSYSTMTFESLIPAFSENTDQTTKYFLKEEIEASECRFIKKAIDENRFIAVYADGCHFFYDDSIKYSGKSQTISEKLWEFTIDIAGAENGLFYLHELYESHYSFANPYTSEKLISNGSAMLFDFLPQNNGCLRTDYEKQHEDALRYLDDTLAPIMKVLPCKIVVIADHGNMVLNPDTKLDEVEKLQLSAAEEWIQIPLIVRSNAFENSRESGLISLMEINDIMLSVMSDLSYDYKSREYIKIGRSTIYNQQFKEIYRLMGCGYIGQAFEGFIFNDGYKLLVYEDGNKELYRIEDDTQINDDAKLEELYSKVKREVTII